MVSRRSIARSNRTVSAPSIATNPEPGSATLNLSSQPHPTTPARAQRPDPRRREGRRLWRSALGRNGTPATTSEVREAEGRWPQPRRHSGESYYEALDRELTRRIRSDLVEAREDLQLF